jgi:hypothetical protein
MSSEVENDVKVSLLMGWSPHVFVSGRMIAGKRADHVRTSAGRQIDGRS